MKNTNPLQLLQMRPDWVSAVMRALLKAHGKSSVPAFRRRDPRSPFYAFRVISLAWLTRSAQS